MCSYYISNCPDFVIVERPTLSAKQQHHCLIPPVLSFLSKDPKHSSPHYLHLAAVKLIHMSQPSMIFP